jgi:hypothetical protein
MNDNDPFASVRANRPQMQNAPKQKENDPFAEVRPKKIEGASNLYETPRHLSRIASRVVETIGGSVGDIESLIQSGIFAGLEKLTGMKADEKVREQAKQDRLPTSGELKKFSQEATKGFTTPQNKLEETGDEFAETIASLLGPMKFRKALGVGVAASLAKEGLKVAGTSEGTQEVGKLGTMFLSSMYNPGGAMKYANNLYNRADALSRGASVQSHVSQGHLVNLLNDLKKGVTTTEKNSVIKPIEDLLKKYKQGGKILVHDLTAAKRDIHAIMKDPETLKGSKKLLKSVGHEIDEAIKPYERINPSFSKVYRPANEIFGAVAEGNKAANLIHKVAGHKSILGAVVAEMAIGHPEYLMPTLATYGGTLATAKTFDFFSRLKKSPELRKYYGKAIEAAIKEDGLSLRKYSNKIDEIMREE